MRLGGVGKRHKIGFRSVSLDEIFGIFPLQSWRSIRSPTDKGASLAVRVIIKAMSLMMQYIAACSITITKDSTRYVLDG